MPKPVPLGPWEDIKDYIRQTWKAWIILIICLVTLIVKQSVDEKDRNSIIEFLLRVGQVSGGVGSLIFLFRFLIYRLLQHFKISSLSIILVAKVIGLDQEQKIHRLIQAYQHRMGLRKLPEGEIKQRILKRTREHDSPRMEEFKPELLNSLWIRDALITWSTTQCVRCFLYIEDDCKTAYLIDQFENVMHWSEGLICLTGPDKLFIPTNNKAVGYQIYHGDFYIEPREPEFVAYTTIWQKFRNRFSRLWGEPCVLRFNINQPDMPEESSLLEARREEGIKRNKNNERAFNDTEAFGIRSKRWYSFTRRGVYDLFATVDNGQLREGIPKDIVDCVMLIPKRSEKIEEAVVFRSDRIRTLLGNWVQERTRRVELQFVQDT